MKIPFYKYQGAGNDFVVIDNRSLTFDDKNVELVEFLCHRRFGIGADGLMLLQNSESSDFEMRYYNSDGREASMCGNGGRCIVAFAKKLGIIDRTTTFMAVDGMHQARVCNDGDIDLQMIDVEKIDTHVDGYFLNTGSPHLVKFVPDLHVVDVEIEGRQLRYDARFQPSGTNVNFVHQLGNELTVYTYERGVECETLACGTGITASALSAAFRSGMQQGTFSVKAKGGNLSVRFKRTNDHFTDVWLKGPAQLVYQGEIEVNF